MGGGGAEATIGSLGLAPSLSQLVSCSLEACERGGFDGTAVAPKDSHSENFWLWRRLVRFNCSCSNSSVISTTGVGSFFDVENMLLIVLENFLKKELFELSFFE